MAIPEALTTYLELRQSNDAGDEGAGLSHTSSGLFLLHVLELASYGEPRGAVTIVHDAGDHGARYLAAARVLAQARWAVALPDLRGHGRSEGLRVDSAGVREVVRDLDAVQDHVAYRQPTAPKVLIGCGLGALYALHYATTKPDALAALVLLAPRWSPRFELPAAPSGLMKMFKKLAPTAQGRLRNTPGQLLSDAEARRAWSDDALVHDFISVRAAQQALELAAQCEIRVRQARLPVLLLHGTADSISSAQTSSGLRGAQLEVRVLDGLAHDLLHEGGVAEHVRDWLALHVR